MGSIPQRWCILRTAGPRTIALTRALQAAGFAAWTPIGVTSRPFRRRQKAGEREYPIAPTFVFAPASDTIALASAAVDPLSKLPAFSIFRHANRVPLIGERDIGGLRMAEVEAATKLQGERDEATRKAERAARADMMRTEAAKRKLLRSEVRTMKPGTRVEVAGVPSLAGISGEVVESTRRGKSAIVSFGGSLIMEIEAWQILPDSLAGTTLAAA